MGDPFNSDPEDPDLMGPEVRRGGGMVADLRLLMCFR